ncbi:hypothetical protein POM88_049931 [Heracleum sosnowskyi]|uniref:Uncharacterized protein n=1 Tax=Heracleum sosnowskyi TaxID=360622 RepID=A0AAD8GWL2_9APIA|nr:hypothetical protein POM88_049931 [Heracleum sosnowskyi]
MTWYIIWDCHGEKSVEVGTNQVNINYKDDDMYDAHDNDFEDCEDFEEESNAIAKEFYRMVTWAGPSKKKARVNKGNWRRNSRTSEEDRMEGAGEARSDSDEESYVDGSNEIMAPKPTHALTHIVRLRWDENTLNTKGAKREAFQSDCIKEFKEYYNYPNNYGEENRDRVVRAHLGRNFKHFLNKEKSRLMKHVNKILKSGYSKENIDITTMKPYYFSQRAWNSICDHWGTPQFKTKSINGTRARELVEFTSRNDAKPFDQKRSEKMAKIRSSQAELTPELSPTDEPSSPRTQKEIQLKKTSK